MKLETINISEHYETANGEKTQVSDHRATADVGKVLTLIGEQLVDKGDVTSQRQHLYAIDLHFRPLA